MRQEEWYRGMNSPSLTDPFSGSVRDGLLYIATLFQTDATAAHMPEKREKTQSRKDVLQMNGITIMLIALVVLGAGYLLYGRWLAKTWGVDPKAKTPAYEMEDGVDYPPTAPGVVFGHQFASIAGAVVHILGGILGLCAVAVLGLIGEMALLTPVNLLLYQAVWLIPGILITEWTRAI